MLFLSSTQNLQQIPNPKQMSLLTSDEDGLTRPISPMEDISLPSPVIPSPTKSTKSTPPKSPKPTSLTLPPSLSTENSPSLVGVSGISVIKARPFQGPPSTNGSPRPFQGPPSTTGSPRPFQGPPSVHNSSVTNNWTRSPESSPPSKSRELGLLSPTSKLGQLQSHAKRLNELAEKYNYCLRRSDTPMLPTHIEATPQYQEPQHKYTMKLIAVIDISIRGTQPPNVLPTPDEPYPDPRLIPTVLQNLAKHIRSLPDRVMDFARCNYRTLSAMVELLLSEGNDNINNGKYLKSCVIIGGNEITLSRESSSNYGGVESNSSDSSLNSKENKENNGPMNKLLKDMYQDENLMKIAVLAWGGALSSSPATINEEVGGGSSNSPVNSACFNEGEGGVSAGFPPSGKQKRQDGKSESCCVC